jgi:hypothetical protein
VKRLAVPIRVGGYGGVGGKKWGKEVVIEVLDSGVVMLR